MLFDSRHHEVKYMKQQTTSIECVDRRRCTAWMNGRVCLALPVYTGELAAAHTCENTAENVEIWGFSKVPQPSSGGHTSGKIKTGKRQLRSIWLSQKHSGPPYPLPDWHSTSGGYFYPRLQITIVLTRLRGASKYSLSVIKRGSFTEVLRFVWIWLSMNPTCRCFVGVSEGVEWYARRSWEVSWGGLWTGCEEGRAESSVSSLCTSKIYQEANG